jgi:hypothetical protein
VHARAETPRPRSFWNKLGFTKEELCHLLEIRKRGRVEFYSERRIEDLKAKLLQCSKAAAETARRKGRR